MKKAFNFFRHLGWIAIICSILGSVLLFFIGAKKTYMAYAIMFLDKEPNPSLSHLESSDIATSYLIMSLDTFLIALVLFIFAHGVLTLFITQKKDMSQKSVKILSWIKTPNIGYLKNVLVEVIIVILFVKFLEQVLTNIDHLDWQILLLPISVFLLSLGLKFLDLSEKD